MCMLVIVAPPIVMGAWSMAFLLEQHVEYYYYIVGERERPNLSAGCVKRPTNAFRPRERNALPFSLVCVSGSVDLPIVLRTYQYWYSTAIYTRTIR